MDLNGTNADTHLGDINMGNIGVRGTKTATSFAHAQPYDWG